MFDNFNLNWLLTIPGILICSGVLLLLIALIIFISTSSKKDKGNKKEEELVNMTTIPEEVVVPVEVNEIIMPTATIDTVNPIPQMEEVKVEPVKEEPTIVSPVSPIMENKIEEDKPIISIYGGVNPANVEINKEETKPIYGGFNPLEATQTIPVINASNEKMIYNEPVVEPIIEPVIEPVLEPINESIIKPVLEPVHESIIKPVVEPINIDAFNVPQYNTPVVPEATIVSPVTEEEPKVVNIESPKEDVEVLDF